MDLRECLARQRQAILDGDARRAAELARRAIRSGFDPSVCLDEGYVDGIREVGRLWAEGEYFLPELVHVIERGRRNSCTVEIGGGSWSRIAAIKDAWLFPWNALFPVAIS